MSMVKKILVRTVVAILAVLVVYFSFTVLVGVSPGQLVMSYRFRQKLRAEAAHAVSNWKQHNVKEYEIDMTFYGWPTFWFQCVSLTEPVTLQVRDEVIVQAEGYDLDVCRETYQHFTIDAMLDHVIAEIESYDPLKSTLHVTFDPEWGYVASYKIRSHAPIWGPSLGESVVQVKVHDFRPSP